MAAVEVGAVVAKGKAGNGNGNGNGNGVTEPLAPQEKRHLVMLEKRIENGLAVFRQVGEALMEIRDKRLYRESHSNFDAYCKARWAFDRGRAYQLIGAAEVARAIPAEFHGPSNEAQARELVPLMRENPSVVAEIWKEVSASDEPVSASRIREVVRQHIPKPDRQQVSDSAAIIGLIDRATDLAQKWVASRPGRAERTRVREAVDRLSAAIPAK
jgi:hypothetical protein